MYGTNTKSVDLTSLHLPEDRFDNLKNILDATESRKDYIFEDTDESPPKMIKKMYNKRGGSLLTSKLLAKRDQEKSQSNQQSKSKHR